MKHPMKYLLVILCLFLSASIYGQEDKNCPIPLVTSDDHSILNQIFQTENNIIYQVRQSDPISDSLYSIPIDGGVSPTLIYQYDGYITVLSFEGNKLLAKLADTQLIEIDFNTDANPLVSTVFEHEKPVRFISTMETIEYVTEYGQLYSLDTATYNSTLITDQLAVGDEGKTRYSATDDYLVYFGRDENDTIGIYSQSQETGEITLLSNDLNVTHGLEGGVYYVFFVTNDAVIFEARNDADQADVYSVSITGGERHLLTTSTVGFGFGGEVALSKNGDYLIYKDGGNLFTVATNGSTPPYLVATVDRLTDHFSLSSDGEFIFYTQDYRLYRATISGESIEVFDAEAPIQTNFTVSQLGTTQYITTAAPNSDQTIGYIQSPDAPMEILFQSVWDYQYGRYVFSVDDEHIIFRAYDGNVTHIFYQHIGDSPIELGCVVEGHVRFLDVINADDPMLVYSVDDRELYIIELEH